MNNNEGIKGTRYHELDWLRVFLILAVFLHHAFMPFNGDDWHIMNSDSSKLLDNIMVYFEQIRLPALFFVAGAGAVLLLKKTTVKTFLLSKFHRLFVPLIFGMLLIVPPQIYYQYTERFANLFDAYLTLSPSFNAHHLWFIEFLIVFMVLAIPIYYLLMHRWGVSILNALQALSKHKHGLFSLVIIIAITRGALKLLDNSQDHGIENASVSVFLLMFFIAGMVFISRLDIWQTLAEYRTTNLKWLIASSALFYTFYFAPNLSSYLSATTGWQLWWLLCTLVSWSSLLSLLGYASAYCKRAPAYLNTANELIYPFYIIHQTIIIVFGFYILQWQSGIALKSFTLLSSSLLICCLVCYYLIRPVPLFRYLFGLKSLKV